MATGTSHAGSRTSLTALLWPLPESEILVAEEKVYYRERHHWASLFNTIIETVAVFVLLMVAFGGYPGGGLLTILVVLGSGVLVWRFLQTRTWTWSEGALLAIVAVLVVSATSGAPSAIGMLVALLASVRLVAFYLRWAFYEHRYITNRRIIETSGFFGSRISSMPLGRVTDISLTRSVFGEVLDYGQMRVESAGQDQALGTISYLIAPEMFHETIVLLATETHA
ncbi:MAG: PH domain-containing protein [Acidimicrobiales bacterium]